MCVYLYWPACRSWKITFIVERGREGEREKCGDGEEGRKRCREGRRESVKMEKRERVGGKVKGENSSRDVED